MFEPEKRMKRAPKIYKVVTKIGDGEGQTRIDLVRARSLAGAADVAARRYITASVATQDDLLAFVSGVSVFDTCGTSF